MVMHLYTCVCVCAYMAMRMCMSACVCVYMVRHMCTHALRVKNPKLASQ